ncbi:MAG: alpha/beta fold hydrolase [Burkholderiales bacterium]|nr:alpha/beta fold hydrolase [Burkholderiales bacterium]
MQAYRAPPWLPGGNAQTIWAATVARRFEGAPPHWRRERWDTPDGDFVDVDHLDVAQGPAHDAGHGAAPAAKPARHLVLFHGLEGSSASQYAQAFAAMARARGWAYSVPHFRGCSGELNLAPRAYHSGDFEEIGWLLARLRAMHPAPLLVVGISLGGNALLRWAEEAGESAAPIASAVAAVCSPIDLAASGQAIDRGFNRLVYARMFLATMKPKALAKLARHPGLFDEERLRAARTLYEFDDIFTAPLHGFRDTQDYWARASAKPRLADIRIPALVLNARNDPFVPVASLPPVDPATRSGRIGRVTLWRPDQGGHVGFPAGRYPAQVTAMPATVCDWLVNPSLV